MKKMGNLIRLLDLDDDFIIDLKYATSDNFTHEVIYDSNECYLDEHTAEILIAAKNLFRTDGYYVKVWDGYRPIRAQRKFWEIMPNEEFVARPPDMSVIKTFRPTHMNGMCVDITLCDNEKKEIEMPSQFDDFTEKAHLSSSLISEKSRRNATYLKNVMESVGFQAYDGEWWHFYDVSTEPKPFSDYPI